jgi:hypothetical protein
LGHLRSLKNKNQKFQKKKLVFHNFVEGVKMPQNQSEKIQKKGNKIDKKGDKKRV